MKTLMITVIAALTIIGCSSQPVAMKSTTKYFAPARTTAMSKASSITNAAQKVTMTSVQKKINEKETVIELLKKENKTLRDRIQRLEKQLKIQNS